MCPSLASLEMCARRRTTVKELVRYLLENLYLDFQGEISLDTVRQFLRGDESREAKQLLAKLIGQGGGRASPHPRRLPEGAHPIRGERAGRPRAALALLGELIG